MKATYISKEKSLCLKGMALFLMVCLHLFNQESLVRECFSLCDVNGMPLAYFLSKGCNPVALYLFASGYGLFYLYKNRKTGGGKNRILKLYIVYWITLLCFVGFGCVLKPDRYPGSWTTVIANATAFHTTYNGEAWFLFPYVLLSATSSLIFKALDRWSVKITLPIIFVMNYGTLFLISRYYNTYFDSHYACYQVALYIESLLPFVTGALFCRYEHCEIRWRWADWLIRHQAALVATFAALFMARCIIDSAAFTAIFIPAFIFIFIHIRWFKPLEKSFRYLGKYSTVVWLVHTWFCYYLFQDFIYGLHYPIAILIVELTVSLAAGHIIQQIVNKVYRLFNL